MELAATVHREDTPEPGLCPNKGLEYFDEADEQQPFLGYELTHGRDYSEQTAALIDRGVQSILNQCHDDVRELLDREHDKLDILAQTLLKDETVKWNDLECILGPWVGEKEGAGSDGGRGIKSGPLICITEMNRTKIN